MAHVGNRLSVPRMCYSSVLVQVCVCGGVCDPQGHRSRSVMGGGVLAVAVHGRKGVCVCCVSVCQQVFWWKSCRLLLVHHVFRTSSWDVSFCGVVRLRCKRKLVGCWLIGF